jgi:hypothetical protein
VSGDWSRESRGPSAFSESVAVALDREHVAVVQEPIEDGGDDGVVAEEFGPLTDGFVGGADGARALLAVGDDLEEVVGFGSRER